jgi:hypothetical protein
MGARATFAIEDEGRIYRGHLLALTRLNGEDRWRCVIAVLQSHFIGRRIQES